MTAPSDTDLNQLLRQVRRLEIRTRRLVDSLAAGGYRSAFRGQGMEFEEVREYVPGDDVRHIDWNVTARSGQPFLKTFREERDLQVMLLVDVSGSMRFGAIPGISPRTKLATAAEAAAVVALTALANNDMIGLVTFTDQTCSHLPVRKGRGHAMRILRECLAPPSASGTTSISHALAELQTVAKRRTVCFLVSDFLSIEPQLGSELVRAGRRHDLVALRIVEPAEAELPGGGAPIAIDDPELGSRHVLSGSRRARARYRNLYQTQSQQISSLFAQAGCDLLDLPTDQSVHGTMQRWFDRRGRRRG